MLSNFSLALITLLVTILVAFLWAIAVFTSGSSIALQEVDTHLAFRNLFFCVTAFTLLYVTSQLPIRRSIVMKLMIGFALIFFGAWQELLSNLVVNQWLMVRWLEIVALPGGLVAATVGIYEVGKAYQLNRLLLGSYRKIEHSLATVDQLTQLHNRRYFFATCPELMSRLQQDGKAPIVICLRIRNMHETNTNFGFQAGDLLLMQTARQLLRHIRSSDIAARLSGRCFAIFLPDTKVVEAEEIVQRFLSHMEHIVLQDSQGKETVVAVAVAYQICQAQEGESFENILHRAKQTTVQSRQTN
jgi:diguanylate cyclase (GGDEF)-like protein